jgi:Fic family protein
MIVSYDTIIVMNYTPPFSITIKILELAQDIGHALGILSGAKLGLPPVMLRKSNQIKTIQSSLAIEGNSLSIDQVTAIVDGKRVLAPQKDLIEVSNAIKLYQNLSKFNPLSIDDLLAAHKLLMQGLIQDNGRWRSSGVGIFKGDKIAHIAPPANRIPLLMNKLFEFINKNNDIAWLIKACVFHYELEFIHPFADGNGRMGRIWQQLLLMQINPIFEYITVETLIKDNQCDYYDSLAKCDSAGESHLFIEFMAAQILEALKLYNSNTISQINTPISRLEFTKIILKQDWFSRKDYQLIHKEISTSTASRDLNFGLQVGILIYKGTKNQTYYQFNQN